VSIDLQKARADTPGTSHVAHLNNAGAALMPAPVLSAVKEHLDLEAEIGGYEAADARREVREHTYDAIARLVGAAREEIAIVENATRAWDMAFYSFDFRAGDRILTARAEYASNYLAYLQVVQRTGAVVEAVPDDESGQLSVEALAEMLDERVKLVAVTHVPTNGGLVNPIEAIGRLTRAAGIPYLVDACQSAGQLPLDVDAIGCDLLAATGRKFLRAPRGTGFLYARRSIVERLHPPFVDLRAATWETVDTYRLRDDARRFETWETNHATKIALGVAADYALGWGLEEIRDANTALADRLRDALHELEGATVLDLGVRPCAIVSFALAGQEPEDVAATLRRRGVNISVSDVVDTRLDMESRGWDQWLRASVHYYNSPDEVDRLVEELRRIVLAD